MGPLLVYSAFGIICLGALARPAIGAIGYIGFVAFTPQWLWRFQLDSTFPFQKWIAACLLVGWLISFFRTKNLGRNTLIPLASLVTVLILGHLSAATSYAPEKTEFFLRQFNKIVLITCVVSLVISTKKSLYAALVVMAAGITFNAFEINADYYRQGFSTVNQDGWSQMNANGYALLMQTATLISFALAQQSRSNPRTAFWLLCALINAHAIMIVESRGAMLGLLFAGVLHLIFMRRTSKNLTLTFCIIVGGLLIAGPPVIKEFASIFAEKLDSSGESRYYIWDAGLRITMDYPLLGVGPWAGEVLVPAYYEGSTKAGQQIIALHNLELEVSTGMGIPAMLAYLLFYFWPWNQARKLLWKQRTDLASEESAIVSGIFLAIPAYWVASQFNSGALVEIPYLMVAILIAKLVQEEHAGAFRKPEKARRETQEEHITGYEQPALSIDA